MAKAKKKSAKKQKIVSEIKTLEPINKAVDARQKKTGLVAAVITFVLLLVVAEIFFVMKKQAQLNKKPILSNFWVSQQKGITGMSISNENLFIIDGPHNEVQRYNKKIGDLLDVFVTEKPPVGAVEFANGDVGIVVANDPYLTIYSNKKIKKKILLEGISQPYGIVGTADDIFFVSDNITGKIVKFSVDGKKIMDFGGKGEAPGRFVGGTKLFKDKDDNIFALDGKTVQVFNSNGKFLRRFILKIEKTSGLENLAITPDGNVYVNDFNGSRIMVFNQKGKNLGNFIKDSSGTFSITYPAALAGGFDGFIYVSTHKLAIFQPIEY